METYVRISAARVLAARFNSPAELATRDKRADTARERGGQRGGRGAEGAEGGSREKESRYHI